MRVAHRDAVACALAGLLTALLSMPVVHAMAVIVGWQPGGGTQLATAFDVTALTLLLGASITTWHAVRGQRSRMWFAPLVIGVSLYLALARSSPSAALAVFVVSTAQALAIPLLAARLSPVAAELSAWRWFTIAGWFGLTALTLVQVARLTTFMADPATDWWLTTRNELWARHMCMPAYLEAADLQRQGVDNVYDATYYSVLVRDAKPRLTMRHLDMFAGDPFQYPPPFLVAPVAALHLTNDFLVMRTVWYAIQFCVLVVGAFLLAAWIGGREAVAAAWLFPLFVVSVPTMQALQYGQFQLAAVVLAVGGMLAFERGHRPLGGGLVSAAILSKMFPGILLILLLVQKRWRDAAWTLAWVGAFTLLGLLVLGTAPFEAFLTYQLPRLLNGQAFAFADQWPELRLPIVVIGNLSPAGVVAKLQELGFRWVGPWTGALLRGAFGVFLIAVLLLSARRRASRRHTACVWLALLNLGAIATQAAWGDYVTFGTVWLLTLHADQFAGSRIRAALLAAAWLLCALVPGVQPMPNFLPVRLALVLTMAITVALVATNAWAVMRERVPRVARTARVPWSPISFGSS